MDNSNNENETAETEEIDASDKKKINVASLVPMPENDIGISPTNVIIGMIHATNCKDMSIFSDSAMR